MFRSLLTSQALAGALVLGASPSYEVPASTPSDAAPLDPAPIGPSYEFFMWPSYMKNITPARHCMELFDDLYGQKTPIRIGGTTQDRATYDADFEGFVSYHVDDPLDAPMELIYGPGFFDLIANEKAETMIGFNRAYNDRNNTFAAIASAASIIPEEFIWGVQLGNEPDLYLWQWDHPVAVEPWNYTQEGADAADWAQDLINRWEDPQPILVGGGYAIPFDYYPNYPNLNHLVGTSYNQTVKNANRAYNGHLYAFTDPSQSDLETEMAHTRVVQDLYLLPIAAAKEANTPYIIGETGFHGLDFIMDAQFGGALQIVDKTLLALSMGVERLFYHQGTINQAFFNWWRDNEVYTPFFGGYFAALAVAGADHVIAGDDGTDRYAQYVVFKDDKASRVVLVNTDYASGNGTRSSTEFVLTGLEDETTVKVIRMTAPSSETMTSLDQSNPALLPRIGGQYFSNEDCSVQGDMDMEEYVVEGGNLKIDVLASEGILVYL